MANKITITGDLGSGKSTIARKLCRFLNFQYFSTGAIQREIAAEAGMNTLEFNYYSETNKDIDKLIDGKLIQLSNDESSFIFDSRLAWFFIKNSFKIYLTVIPEIAAMRVLEDQDRKNEPEAKHVREKSMKLLERRGAEDKRFKITYGVDCADLNNYDLIIDTSKSSIDEITHVILETYSQWKKNLPFQKFWVSPFTLYPTEHVRQLGDSKSIYSVRDNCEPNDLIETVKVGEFLYIWNGHKRTSSAILNRVSLIPISILAKDSEYIHEGHSAAMFVQSTVKISWIYDWESMHNFKFDLYPPVKQNQKR